MKSKSPVRVDTSTAAVIDLSPEIIAARVVRLDQVRRTALAAQKVRAQLAGNNESDKS